MAQGCKPTNAHLLPIFAKARDANSFFQEPTEEKKGALQLNDDFTPDFVGRILGQLEGSNMTLLGITHLENYTCLRYDYNHAGNKTELHLTLYPVEPKGVYLDMHLQHTPGEHEVNGPGPYCCRPPTDEERIETYNVPAVEGEVNSQFGLTITTEPFTPAAEG